MANSYDDIFSNLMSTTAQASEAMGRAISSSNATTIDYMDKALGYLDKSYTQAQAYLTPFRKAGEQGIDTLMNFIGANGQAAQQQALTSITQTAMNDMVKYGPQVAQQAMGMFFGAAGVPAPQTNQILNQSTAQAIQATQAQNALNPETINTNITNLKNQIANTTDKGQLVTLNNELGKWNDRQTAYNYMKETGKPYQGYTAQDVQAVNNPNAGVPTNPVTGQDMSGVFNQYMGQYNRLMNTSPEQLSNSMLGSLLDPVTGAVTKATKGFTDSMMKYGTQAVENSAAAKGMLNSGRALTELNDYGMGVAGQYVIPAMQNVLQMGMNSGNNLVSGILNQGGNILGQQTSLASNYMNNVLNQGTQLASSQIGATQNALSNLLNTATGAATSGANLAGQQGQVGSGYYQATGKTLSDNTLLAGKVEADALNTIGQLQFIQDMGPYINQLGAIPGITGGSGGTVGNAMAQHNAVDGQAQNYLRNMGGNQGGGAIDYGGLGAYAASRGQGISYSNSGGQAWVNPTGSGGGSWGTVYLPKSG